MSKDRSGKAGGRSSRTGGRDGSFVNEEGIPSDVRQPQGGRAFAGMVGTDRSEAMAEADRLNEQAFAAADAGELEAAAELFDRALELVPDYPDALFGKAYALSRLGHELVRVDRLRAREVLAEASDLGRAMPETSRLFAGTMSNLNAALCDLAKTWEGEDPERADAFTAEALEHILRAREAAPDDLDVAHNLTVTFALASRIAQSMDDADRALAMAEEALVSAEATRDLAPDNVEPALVHIGAIGRTGDLMVAIGDLEEGMARYEQAAAEGERLRTIAPYDPEALVASGRPHLAIAEVLAWEAPDQAMEHYDAALACCYQVLLDLAPGFTQAHEQAAEILESRGRTVAAWDPEEARELLEEAVDHVLAAVDCEPDSVGTCIKSGGALARLGDLLGIDDPAQGREVLLNAIELLERAVQLAPDDWIPWWSLGQSHVALAGLGRTHVGHDEDHLQAALEAFEHMLVLQPNSAFHLHEAAMTLQGLSVVAHHDQGRAEPALGYLARGIELSERAVAVEPDNPDYLTGLQAGCTDCGNILVKSGQAEEGARLLQRGLELGTRATELAPDYWWPWWNLSMYYLYTDQPEEAFEALREALRCDPGSWGNVEDDHEWDGLRDRPTYLELEAEYKPRAR